MNIAVKIVDKDSLWINEARIITATIFVLMMIPGLSLFMKQHVIGNNE